MYSWDHTKLKKDCSKKEQSFFVSNTLIDYLSNSNKTDTIVFPLLYCISFNSFKRYIFNI